MQRAILSFELPEDKDAYKQCNMGADMWQVLYEIDQMLRSRVKHTDLSKDAEALAEEVRDMIRELPMDSIQ